MNQLTSSCLSTVMRVLVLNISKAPSNILANALHSQVFRPVLWLGYNSLISVLWWLFISLRCLSNPLWFTPFLPPLHSEWITHPDLCIRTYYSVICVCVCLFLELLKNRDKTFYLIFPACSSWYIIRMKWINKSSN